MFDLSSSVPSEGSFAGFSNLYHPASGSFLGKAAAAQCLLSRRASPKTDRPQSSPFKPSRQWIIRRTLPLSPMNECLKLGGGKGHLNVRMWVQVRWHTSNFEGACPKARAHVPRQSAQASTAASHRLPVHCGNASRRIDRRRLPWPSPVRAARQHGRSCSGTPARVKRNCARPRAASTRGEADRISVISLPRSTSSSPSPSLAGGLSPC